MHKPSNVEPNVLYLWKHVKYIMSLFRVGGKLECDHFNPDGDYWVFKGNKIVNRRNPDQCLDIYGQNWDDGAEVGAYDYHGANNQHWKQEFVN